MSFLYDTAIANRQATVSWNIYCLNGFACSVYTFETRKVDKDGTKSARMISPTGLLLQDV